jgi:putative alpha-1,2-mannosidase
MLGLYPVVTQPIYLLGSPWFKDINITVNHNETLRITAEGLGEDSIYVQSVRINGEAWEKNWVGHEKMGKEQKVWETGEVAPSPGRLE